MEGRNGCLLTSSHVYYNEIQNDSFLGFLKTTRAMRADSIIGVDVRAPQELIELIASRSVRNTPRTSQTIDATVNFKQVVYHHESSMAIKVV